MPASDLDGWICPQCGRTNYYHPSHCGHCDYELGSSESTINDSPAPRRDPFRYRLEEDAAFLQKRVIFLSLTGLALIAWLYLIWEYRKWGARWGPINVMVPALIAAAVIAIWISRRNWFRERGNPTRWRFMIIPVTGFIVCAAAGIYFTEPIEVGGTVTRSGDRVENDRSTAAVNRRSPNYQYDYGLTRASRFYLASSLFDLGEGAGSVADDVDEGCLLFLLVILVIVLIIGSFVIPHFWALATFVLLVIMALITYREWRLLESSNDQLVNQN